MSSWWSKVCDLIIRPPVAEYSLENLGPINFTLNGKPFSRDDFKLKNSRNQQLACSWFHPRFTGNSTFPCVIFCHGNSSCRLEALELCPLLLPQDISIFAFDFAGCGLSEGEFISLGYYESQDILTIVNYLRATGKVGHIGLWGRSMGAASCLLYSESDPSIACMILDSAFSSLPVLMTEIVSTFTFSKYVPSVATNLGIKMMRNSIKKKCKFDINEVNPLKHSDKSFIPSIFIHGKIDELVPYHHSEELHSKYGGEKNLILIDSQGHNGSRPDYVLDTCVLFLVVKLISEKDHYESFKQRHLNAKKNQDISKKKANATGLESVSEVLDLPLTFIPSKPLLIKEPSVISSRSDINVSRDKASDKFVHKNKLENDIPPPSTESDPLIAALKRQSIVFQSPRRSTSSQKKEIKSIDEETSSHVTQDVENETDEQAQVLEAMWLSLEEYSHQIQEKNNKSENILNKETEDIEKQLENAKRLSLQPY